MALGNTVEAVIGASLSPSFGKTFLNAKTATKQLGSTISDLSKKTAAVKVLKDLDTSVKSAGQAVATAERRLESINRRIADGEEQTDKLVNSWIAAETRLERAREKFKALETQLDKQKRSAEKSGQATDNLSRRYDTLQRQLGDATRAQERFNAQMEKSQHLQDKAGKYAMGAAGAAAAGYIGTRMIAPALTTGMEFDTAASSVKAIATSKGEFETLGQAHDALLDKIQQLGAETSYTSTEVASAAKYLTMAGFDITKTIGALPATLDLARAGALDLGQTADIMSNIMTPFNIGAEHTSEVADILAKTVTTSNTDMAQLGDTMKYVAPVAYGVGLSLEKTAAMAGLLANSGIQASQGGTVLRSMLTRLAAPTSTANKYIEQLGLSLRTATGDLRDPIDLLSEMGEAMSTKKWGSAQKLQAISEVFGQEAMAGAKTLIDAAERSGKDGSEALQKYLAEIAKVKTTERGFAREVAKTQMDNLGGDLIELGGAVESSYLTMYGAMRPLLRTTSKWMTDNIRGVNDFLKKSPTFTKTLGIIAFAFTGTAFAAAGLLTILAANAAMGAVLAKTNAALALSLGKTAAGTGLMSTAMMGLQVVMGGVGTAMKALFLSPLGLVVAGVVLAAMLIYKYWEPIKAFGVGVWEGLSASMSGFAGALKPIQPMLDVLGDGIAWVADAVMWLVAPADTATDTLTGFQKAGYLVGAALSFILTPAQVAVGMLTRFVEVLGTIGQLFTDDVGTWGDKLSRVGDAIYDFLTYPLQVLEEKLGLVAKGFKSFTSWFSSEEEGAPPTYARPVTDNPAPTRPASKSYYDYQAAKDTVMGYGGYGGARATTIDQSSNIERMEINVTGSADPNETAEAVHRKFERERARREREALD